jgi:hypothetical protein
MIAGPPTTQPSSLSASSMFPNKFLPPILPPNFQGNSTQPPILPPNSSNILPPSSHMSPTHPPTGSENQQPFHSQPPMMTNGMSMPSTDLHFKYVNIHWF